MSFVFYFLVLCVMFIASISIDNNKSVYNAFVSLVSCCELFCVDLCFVFFFRFVLLSFSFTISEIGSKKPCITFSNYTNKRFNLFLNVYFLKQQRQQQQDILRNTFRKRFIHHCSPLSSRLTFYFGFIILYICTIYI